jgi:tetratricopeptide (TPR) repeat protein
MSNLSPNQILQKSADLLARKEFARAEKHLSSGLKTHPDNFDIALNYARAAEQAGKWKDAVERWKYVRQKHPTLPLGYTGGILALLVLNKDAEAEQLADEGIESFATDVWFVHSCGSLYVKKRDYDKALELYKSLQRYSPDHSRGFTGEIEVLIAAGKFEEAEAAANSAILRFKDDVWLAHTYATIATRQSDWQNAAARWEALIRKFPNHKIAYELRDAALSNLGTVDR